MLAPRLRLLELTLYRNYYQEHNPTQIGDRGFVKKKFCKINNIQISVANLRGWQLGLSAILYKCNSSSVSPQVGNPFC